MDETERLRVTQAYASRILLTKTLFYEIMKKNVGLITLISVFIPGGAQIYLTQYLKGILILLFSWLVIPWLYGIYDAYTTSSKYNNELYMLIFPETVAITTADVQIQEQMCKFRSRCANSGADVQIQEQM
jgi:TM2 domain-containing membrane protein YozV